MVMFDQTHSQDVSDARRRQIAALKFPHQLLMGQTENPFRKCFVMSAHFSVNQIFSEKKLL